MTTASTVVLREIAMELREPFVISSGSAHARRVLLVELRTADGAVGWGECVAGERPSYSEETVDTAWLALESWLVPALMDAGPGVLEHPLQLRAVLDEAGKGHRMAKACLEMAAFALDAERRGIALATSIGGGHERVPVGISLGLQPRIEDLVTRALAARDQGYRRVKIKIARGRDLDPVRAVRRALGESVELTVDANAAYREEDEALMLELDREGLGMIEQPLPAGALAALARLQLLMTTPICLDESVTGPDELDSALALGSGRVLNLKPGRVGGIAASLAIHERARRAGLPLWCGGMLETGIGRAFNVALASLPGFTLPNDLSPSARYWHEDVVEPEWTMDDDGFVRVPFDRPGLGVRVRRDRIDALTRRRSDRA